MFTSATEEKTVNPYSLSSMEFEVYGTDPRSIFDEDDIFPTPAAPPASSSSSIHVEMKTAKKTHRKLASFNVSKIMSLKNLLRSSRSSGDVRPPKPNHVLSSDSLNRPYDTATSSIKTAIRYKKAYLEFLRRMEEDKVSYAVPATIELENEKKVLVLPIEESKLVPAKSGEFIVSDGKVKNEEEELIESLTDWWLERWNESKPVANEYHPNQVQEFSMKRSNRAESNLNVIFHEDDEEEDLTNEQIILSAEEKEHIIESVMDALDPSSKFVEHEDFLKDFVQTTTPGDIQVVQEESFSTKIRSEDNEPLIQLTSPLMNKVALDDKVKENELFSALSRALPPSPTKAMIHQEDSLAMLSPITSPAAKVNKIREDNGMFFGEQGGRRWVSWLKNKVLIQN